MLLDRAEGIKTDPFPHLVIENALEPLYYERLAAQRPPMNAIVKGAYSPNQRIDMRTHEAVAVLSQIWREFCEYHTSTEFLGKVWDVFGGEIAKRYPEVKRSDVLMRCQPGINTPTSVATRVRGPHLDNPSELYAGLFYMATDDDGGDLEIYRWNSKPKRFHGKLEVGDECVELVSTVKYRPNTYVMFLNTENALHGVTPRKSNHSRNLVNIVGDVSWPLFHVGHGRY